MWAPPPLAAMQNDAEGHETEAALGSGPSPVGVDHEVPFQATPPPTSATATQNDAEGHETEVRLVSPSMRVGRGHRCRCR